MRPSRPEDDFESSRRPSRPGYPSRPDDSDIGIDLDNDDYELQEGLHNQGDPDQDQVVHLNQDPDLILIVQEARTLTEISSDVNFVLMVNAEFRRTG